MSPRVHEFYVNYVWKRGLKLTTMTATRLSDAELVPVTTPEAAAALGLTVEGGDSAAQSLCAEVFTAFEKISTNQYAIPELEKVPRRVFCLAGWVGF